VSFSSAALDGLLNLREDAPAFVRDLKPKLAGIFAHDANSCSVRTNNRLTQVREFEPDQVRLYRLP